MKNSDLTLTQIAVRDCTAPLERYAAAKANWKACRRDLIKFNLRKLSFHARGLLRAIFGL